MKQYMKKFFHKAAGSQAGDILYSSVFDSEYARLLEYATPNLISYVWWVLRDAVEKHIETLYFTSREGFLLHRLAEVFTVRFSLPITCRYLYCSEKSLQIPSYRLLDDDKYKLICRGGYGVSPAVILGRASLSQKERGLIYNDICFDIANEHMHLSLSGRKRFAARLRTSRQFRALVLEKSLGAYENTIGYLKQEGLMSGKRFALVSLGFTGRMQRTLRLLLESAGAPVRLRGYYFGLYDFPYDSKDGSYQTFYFNPHSASSSKVKFSRHLLESICCAPHTGVMNYAHKMGEYSAVLTKPEFESDTPYKQMKPLQDMLIAIAQRLTESEAFRALRPRQLLHMLRVINKRIIYNPTEEQARAFADIFYFHGNSEVNGTPLALEFSHDEIKNYGFFARLKRKRRFNSDENLYPCVFWSYGSLALTKDIKHKGFYRHAFFIWDLGRMILLNK